MPPYRDDDEDQDWEDEEADLEADSDEEPTIACPYCRRQILEDSPQCPFCGNFISEEDHPGPNKPLWVIATALLCLGMALWWVFAAF
jgi:hypothetical protein